MSRIAAIGAMDAARGLRARRHRGRRRGRPGVGACGLGRAEDDVGLVLLTPEARLSLPTRSRPASGSGRWCPSESRAAPAALRAEVDTEVHERLQRPRPRARARSPTRRRPPRSSSERAGSRARPPRRRRRRDDAPGNTPRPARSGSGRSSGRSRSCSGARARRSWACREPRYPELIERLSLRCTSSSARMRR